MTARREIAVVAVLLAGVCGCSHEKACGPCGSGARQSPAHESAAPAAREQSAAPASDRPATVEARDAHAGEKADRTGANPERVPGIDIKNLSREGDIWIGGEPSSQGYAQVHDRGVAAVVDLRNPTPVQKASADQARTLGMDYVNLPIDPKNMEDAKASEFLTFMKEHQGKQVLIHCGSANRASGMYAVYLGAVKGLPADEALERAKLTGLKESALERDVREFLEKNYPQKTK